MKSIKRTLAVLLTVLMLMSVVPVGVMNVAAERIYGVYLIVVFKSDGKTGEMNCIYAEQNQKGSLPANLFEKSGYVFNGWQVNRLSDEKWLTVNNGWKTEKEIKNGSFQKRLFKNKETVVFDSKWKEGRTIEERQLDEIYFNAFWKKACKTHSWDAGVVTKSATTAETGTKLYTCKVCGQTKTETIPKNKVDATWSKISVTGLGATNAQINATVTFAETVKHEKCGFYFGTSSSNLKKAAKYDTINKSRKLTNMWYDLNKFGQTLKANTTYYYQFYIVANGTEYKSSVQMFTTLPSTPTVTLRPVDHIETNAATVHLTAKNPSKLLITARGVQVKKKGASSWAKTYSEDLSKKSYNKDTEITGYFDIGSGKEVNYALSAGTTYEYRCFVTSGGTNYYSNVSTFTTKPGLKPTWSKYNTSNITETNAKIEARVTFNQSVKHEKCGFYLGTQSGKLTKNAKGDTINKNRTYTDMWYDLNKWYGKLKPGTTYYYQFFIVANGTEYKSAEKSFKTKGTPVTEYNFTVKYNANGGTGTMADQTAKGGQVLTMTQNQFKRAGYDFVGWNVKRGSDSKWFVSGQGWKTESDISKNKWTKKVYGNGITFTFDSSWSSGAKPTDTFTFYAVWKECEHVWNDGIVTKEPTTKATGVKTFTCERCGKTKTEKIPKITAFAIKYVANGGKGTMAGTTVQTGDTFTLPECAFTKGGAFFSGWAVKRSSDSKWYTTNGTWETAKAITTNGLSKEVFDAGTEYELNEEWINGSKNTDTYSFYAIWIACEHEWDDGEMTKEPTTKATGVMTYTCELCGTTKTEKIPKLTSYQIKYAANGGKGTMTGTKVLKDDAFTLSECEFTRSGYTFNGWMVKRTSDSKWLTEEDSWKTDKTIKADDLTKAVFDSDTEICLDEDWINGTKNVDTYTFYAVWVKE